MEGSGKDQVSGEGREGEGEEKGWRGVARTR